MDFNELRTDDNKSKGTWLKYDESDDAQFLIASAEDEAYLKQVRRTVGGIPSHKLKKNPKLADVPTRKAMAKHILLDWKNVTDNGEPIEATEENRFKYLELKTFGNWVANQAMDISNFQTEDEAESVDALKSDPPLDD